ncbi:GntR family transcriptional regulator [Clostridium sp. MCC353]|uniref:GntR family transcriptional regulator n=1 Tax=Clostridium sp. MCC353 TaxID=2592646 RepID=UPI001C033AF5|nr:GntR family transcriptional regulator [Clostridium sp. MCC353]MBT9775384.1 GntR family transcriptional regulator [Clostridium sp. MCC353]
MPWSFESDRPIYTQLLEKIRLNIISGTYPIGSKLPSVRDLAAEAAVNPNTMQKALAELERSGLIYSQRTSGRYVTEDAGMIQKIKEDMAQEKIEEFMKLMKQIGFEPEEICILIEKTIKEGKL